MNAMEKRIDTEELARRLRQLRKETGETLEQVGKAVGVTRQYMSSIERGKQTPGKTVINTLADHFDVDLNYLYGNTDQRKAVDLTGVFEEGYYQGQRDMSLCSIPIYSCISCGSGTWVDEFPEEQMSIPTSMLSPGAEYFANPAEGDSMNSLIHHGDYLIFERTDEVDNGKIGSFALNGEYYCKRLQIDPDGSVWLRSQNPAYEPIPVNPEDDFRVLGLYRFKLSKEQ